MFIFCRTSEISNSWLNLVLWNFRALIHMEEGESWKWAKASSTALFIKDWIKTESFRLWKIPMLDYGASDGTVPWGTIVCVWGGSDFPSEKWTIFLLSLLGSWQLLGQKVKTWREVLGWKWLSGPPDCWAWTLKTRDKLEGTSGR